jgi:hypothetical protein
MFSHLIFKASSHSRVYMAYSMVAGSKAAGGVKLTTHHRSVELKD